MVRTRVLMLIALGVAAGLCYFCLSLPITAWWDSVRQGPELSTTPPRPPVLSCATNGRWVQSHVTEKQKRETYDLFRFALEWQQVPNTLQRADGRCGDVTYVQKGPNMWIRALCNPTGPTPCCVKNRCAARSEQDCACPNCVDLRRQIIAEHSRWEMAEPDCRVHNFTREEACRLLKGASLVFVGDSLMRHVYTAALLLLSGNPRDGALADGVSKEIHDSCTEGKMFTEKVCRLHLKSRTRLCNGSVNIDLQEYYASRYSKEFHKVLRSYLGRNNTYMFVGICLHDNCNAEGIFRQYAKPALDLVNSSRVATPRLVWVGPHAPGVFKTPGAKTVNQDESGILRFISYTRQKLQPYGVPVFDTVNLTRGVASFDGTHTGLAVNVLKFQILLNHIQERNSAKRTARGRR